MKYFYTYVTLFLLHIVSVSFCADSSADVNNYQNFITHCAIEKYIMHKLEELSKEKEYKTLKLHRKPLKVSGTATLKGWGIDCGSVYGVARKPCVLSIWGTHEFIADDTGINQQEFRENFFRLMWHDASMSICAEYSPQPQRSLSSYTQAGYFMTIARLNAQVLPANLFDAPKDQLFYSQRQCEEAWQKHVKQKQRQLEAAWKKHCEDADGTHTVVV